MRDDLLRLERISKVYETEDVETHALADVHLCVQRGEFVSLSGPSGSGKSTLLAILGLLDIASTGQYFLDGREVSALGARELARIRNAEVGFIFQSFNLIPQMTVFENVQLPLLYRDMDEHTRRKRVDEVLESVQMRHRRNHNPGQLSGGQQQRVAFARAIVGSPKIILADEPTGNLDSANGEAVMELLRGLHRDGSTICMVTHDARCARYAERGVTLFDGSIVGDGTTPQSA